MVRGSGSRRWLREGRALRSGVIQGLAIMAVALALVGFWVIAYTVAQEYSQAYMFCKVRWPKPRRALPSSVGRHGRWILWTQSLCCFVEQLKVLWTGGRGDRV